MNRENMEKWVKALCSGEFQQTKGSMAREESGKRKHCCLGVACEVAIADGVPVKVDVRDDGVVEYDGMGNVSYLPVKVAEWLGVPEGSSTHILALKNDSGEPFHEIADMIAEDRYHIFTPEEGS